MRYEEQPMHEPPSDFLRSVALFIVTMGTVFGVGVIWTNYGDQIAVKWKKDWRGMEERWVESTSPQKKKPGAGILEAIPGSPWSRDGFGHDMRPAGNIHRSSNRAVVPMIDTRKPGR